jgi:hypothetical protein
VDFFIFYFETKGHTTPYITRRQNTPPAQATGRAVPRQAKEKEERKGKLSGKL